MISTEKVTGKQKETKDKHVYDTSEYIKLKHIIFLDKKAKTIC